MSVYWVYGQFIVSFLATLGLSFSSDCSEKTYVLYDSKEIRLFNEKTTYYEARDKCKMWGRAWLSGMTGRLVTISSSSKQHCIEEMVSTRGNYAASTWKGVNPFVAGYYIGADDLNQEGIWMWSDDTRVALGQSGYNNWGKYEPSQGWKTQDCANLLIKDTNYENYSLGRWVDIPCHNTIYYICERDISTQRIWSYNNNDHGLQPKDWVQKYPACGGRMQSPISLKFPSLLKKCEDSVGIVRGWNNARTVRLTITNTGRYIRLAAKEKWTTTFKYGEEKHYISHILLHIGSSRRKGSEHAFGQRKFDAEVQVFHRPAANRKIYALAFFLSERATTDNHNWDKLLVNIAHLNVAARSTIQVPENYIQTLLSDTSSRGFLSDYILGLGVRYVGSLPYPPCTENVIWTVHPRPVELSASQFHTLRSIKMEGGLEMKDNYRPLQPTMSRNTCFVN